MIDRHKINLSLFAVDVPEAAKEFDTDTQAITYSPPSRGMEVVKAAYIKGIESALSEILAHMEEDDFILALDGIRRGAEALEGIDKSLKAIAEHMGPGYA